VLIAATGTSVMIPVYLYCSFYFVITALVFTALLRKFKDSAVMRDLHQKLSSAYVLRVQAGNAS
jgi:polar amino acid transport system permease protein